jgi:hypothetical protein
MKEIVTTSLRISDNTSIDVYLYNLLGQYPNPNIGNVNDYALDISSGRVYKKISNNFWEIFISCIDGFKQRVKVATTFSGNLNTDFQQGSVVDGVTLTAGDRILIKDQVSAIENGIYVIQTSGAPLRASDSSDDLSIRSSIVPVLEGVQNANEIYKNTNTSIITIGVTPITYSSITPGGSTYTNLNPTPISIGGITSGSTFNNKTFKEMFDALLYPYQNPAFTSFSSSLFTTYEVGQSLPSGISTINYSISHPTNFLPVQPNGNQSTNIPGASFVIPNPISLAASGSFQINIPVNSNLTSPGTRTISLSGTNTNSNIFSTSGTMTWRYRIFYGNSSNTSLVEADILSLSNSLLASSAAGTYSYSAGPGTYKWICYPQSMPLLNTFIDTLTNFNVPFEPPIIVSVTNAYSVTTNYRCHRSTNPIGGAINIAMS